MSKKSKQSGRDLVADFDLWARVSKTVDPINPKLAQELADFEKLMVPSNGTKSKIVQAPKKSIKSNQVVLRNSIPPQLTGLDKQLGRRFLRGNVIIDARLDLHGESVESAQHRLYQFLLDCSAKSLRTVLVITGKGKAQFARHTLHSQDYHDSSKRSGKLRNALPGWLHESHFRLLVTGFQPAHPKHGGGGAVYIRLRNLRKGL